MHGEYGLAGGVDVDPGVVAPDGAAATRGNDVEVGRSRGACGWRKGHEYDEAHEQTREGDNLRDERMPAIVQHVEPLGALAHGGPSWSAWLQPPPPARAIYLLPP